jgi:murein DD-endopeptidase MepM/ murein hydrolase activator NlpD
MPLAFFRLGLFAWGERDRVGRILLFLLGAALALPLLFGIGVNAAVSGLPTPAGGPAQPMAGWQVSQPFGCTGFSFEPARGGCAHFHSGIDLVGPSGCRVFAVLAGIAEVRQPAGYGGGYGVHVIVHHDAETSTMYAHLVAASVLSGQPVTAGALIGYEGSTGLSTGAHLHFEVRRAGVPVDPAAFFPSLFGSSGAAKHRGGATAPAI